MRYKRIVHKLDMEHAINEGITKIAGIVKRTLGPGGLPIMLERVGQALDGSPLSPLSTKDGVSVAAECQDPDELVDLVIQSVKEICQKTNRVAGDGTTTAIVLGEALVLAAQEMLRSNPELNPQLVRESMELAAEKAKAFLREQAIEIKSDLTKIRDVATISANGDLQVGEVIAKAFAEVGSEGVITVDEGHTAKTTVSVVDGFQIKRGAEAQDRFFNSKDNTRFEAENVRVVLYNGSLMNYTAVNAIFNKIASDPEVATKGVFPPTLIIADEFSQEVIQFLLINRAQAALSVCAVRSPHASHIRTAIMDDMAIMLGGTRLGNGNSTLEDAKITDIGMAERVIVDKYHTTFYGGAGTEQSILDRISALKIQRTQAESPYDAQVISDRIAALSGGIAKIAVGGNTEFEIKERYHRIEDALNAARAAIEEGVIAGGGIATAKASHLLQSEDMTVGEKILSQALEAPFLQIADNVGENGRAILDSILPDVLVKGERKTFDARNKAVVDAFEAGIIDPLKVTLTALENAVSIAALLITTGGAVVYGRDKK